MLDSAPTRTLRDVYRIVFRHQRKALLWFAGTLVLAIIAIIVAPRTYQSEARLFFKIGRNSVTLDPTAALGQTMNVYDSRESEVRSYLDMLESRVIVERVVDQLGAAAILRPSRKAHRTANDPATPLAAGSSFRPSSLITVPVFTVAEWLGVVEPLSERERAVQKVSRSIRIDAQKKSNVVSILGKFETPEAARAIVQAFVDAFYDEHLKAHRDAGSRQFFDTQVDLLGRQLATAEQDLRTAKDTVGVVELDFQQKNVEDQLSKLQLEVLGAESALRTSQAKVAALERELETIPERIVTQQVDGHANVAADQMRNELYRLEIQLQEMLTKYTESHPKIASLREQVSKAKAIHEEQKNARTQVTHEVDPARRQLRLELHSETAQAAALQAKVTTLRTQLADMRTTARELNVHAIRIAEVQRRVEAAQVSYKSYVHGREQARIDEALERERLSSVKIVQPATYVTKPVAPKKVALLSVGLMLATFGAFGVALVSEHFDHSFKTPEEVEERLELPVFLSIPSLQRRSVLLN